MGTEVHPAMLEERIREMENEVDTVKLQRDALAQAMWDARGILGFDNDGLQSPLAAIHGNYKQFADAHVAEAKQQRDDYNEVMDLWDGTERKDWTARAEKAEKDRDIYKDAFKDAAMANTVAAQNLAKQEAKTVEYRAAWIKATRERDHYRTLLREAAKPTIAYCDRHNPNGIGRIEAGCDWCAALGVDQEWVERLREVAGATPAEVTE